MTGVFGIMRAAILADGTIPALINSKVHSFIAPDNEKPPYITLVGSGNTPIQTAGSTMLELPHVTLNVYVAGRDWTTLKAIVDALTPLFKLYNEQSGGRSYTIKRIFDMPGVDPDGSFKWSFEYLATITDS